MRKLKNDELGRMNVEAFKTAEKNPIILVLDNLRSLNNIGSIFRTADAFRIEGIYLCGITATPPHRDIQKTALGATESVEWSYFENTKTAIEKLKESGYQVIALEQTTGSTLLHQFIPDPHAKYALVLGNEVKGVAQEITEIVDACVEIPQFGTKHSFNVSVSTGIAVWSILLKMNRI